MCQNVYIDRMRPPKLLIINKKHPVAHDFFQFEADNRRKADLCTQTNKITEHFRIVHLKTWRKLREIVESKQTTVCNIVDELGIWMDMPLSIPSDISELRKQLCHDLHVSWFNFSALKFLSNEFLSECSDLSQEWKEYCNSFVEYCSARHLKDYVNVFFQVEEQNIFLLEVDECFDSFTLMDIISLRKSLSIALDIPSVSLHLVTVTAGSVVIYFYYCFSNYLSVFESLTPSQLKEISEIRPCKIMSLSDFKHQFQYENIQEVCIITSTIL